MLALFGVSCFEMVTEKMMFKVSMVVSLANAKKPKLKGNTFEAVMMSIAE